MWGEEDDEAIGISIDAGDLRIVGTLRDLRRLQTPAGERFLHTTCAASSITNVRRRLVAWVTLLAGRASGLDLDVELLGPPPARSKLPYGQVGLSAPELDAASARARLVALARLWIRLRCEPLPLFAMTSQKIATALHNEGAQVDAAGHGTPSSALVAAASKGLNGGFKGRGDLDDPYTAALFGGVDIEDLMEREGPDSVRGLAAAVWLPFLQTVVERGVFEETWRGR